MDDEQTSTPAADDVVTAFSERLDQLELENHELRARLDARASGEVRVTPAPSVTRRRMLVGGAAAAVGAVAATTPSQSAAAGGGPLPVYRNVSNTTLQSTSINGAIVGGGGTGAGIFTSVLSLSNDHPTIGSAMYAFAQTYGVAALASGTGGVGVFSRSEAGGQGVQGWVYGSAPSSEFTAGVFGQSSYPESPAFLADAHIALRQTENDSLPPADGVRAGDLSIINSGDDTSWSVCTQASVGGAAPEYVKVVARGAAGAFVPLPAPLRVFDTRPGTSATNAKTPLVGGTAATFDVAAASAGAIPSDATAIVLNLTVAGGSERGFAAAYAGTAVYSGTSNLNFEAGQAVANQVTTALGIGATLSLQCGEAGVTVNAIVDVTGYYA